MIKDIINKQIADALKAKDEIRLSTLRMLSSALNYEFIAKQHELNEEEEMLVVQREAKKRKDAIDIYQKLQDSNKPNPKLDVNLQREKKELEVLKEYLPEQLSEKELEKIVAETIAQTSASSIADMGKVMGAVMSKAKGKADGGLVAKLVKEKLSSGR
jgi:uncharacterized protein YqeY